ncbi:MAG: hypothetical protein AAFZ15_15900 [Bacteroidota bacterium]
MKNIFRIHSTVQLHDLFHATLSVLMLIVLISMFALNASAQNERIAATDILDKINKAQPVEISNKTIVGDLDFTTLKKKFRGGSYGVRKGVVKEYFTKLLAPMTLKNCIIEGEIITFSEDQKPGILKENFVAFDQLAVFENCQFQSDVTFERMTFYQGIEIKNCTFVKSLKFDRVHFAVAPLIEGGNALSKLINRKTNWDGMSKELPTPEKWEEDENVVTLILNNNTASEVQIRFDRTTWNLSPFGKSSLITEIGTEVHLLKKGKKERVLITAAKEMDGQEFKISQL